MANNDAAISPERAEANEENVKEHDDNKMRVDALGDNEIRTVKK